jgi:hypothetical protein
MMPIPISTLPTRKRSYLAENVKYAKIFNNIFNLQSNRYFIKDGFTSSYLGTTLCLSTALPIKNKYTNITVYNSAINPESYAYCIQYA